MQERLSRLSCGRNTRVASLLIFGWCAQVTAAPAPSNTSPITASLSADWKTTVGATTAATFGANDEMCSSPAHGSGDSAYAKNLSRIGIKFYRLHCGSLTDDWSNPSTRQWNVQAITAEYDAPYLRGATIIQNIPAPPSWLRNRDGTVSDAAGYAAYCAQLVNIVNHQLKKRVVYWEPMNEWEDRYKGNWTQACEVYNQCVQAMKRQDPSIKVGPALEWPNQGGIIQPFLRQCAGNIDFIAYHSYYSSGPTDSNDTLMTKASAMDHDVTSTRDSIRQFGQGRVLPIMLDEYNLDGNWNDAETRQYTNIGAVYFATTLKHDAYAGAYACSIWSAKEGTYGITDMSDHLRTPAYLFQWANHHLIGSLVKTVSSSPMVEAMAVRQNGTPAIMVINKASGTATISLASNMASPIVEYCTLTASGMSAARTMAAVKLSSFVMQPCSLLFISAAKRHEQPLKKAPGKRRGLSVARESHPLPGGAGRRRRSAGRGPGGRLPSSHRSWRGPAGPPPRA